MRGGTFPDILSVFVLFSVFSILYCAIRSCVNAYRENEITWESSENWRRRLVILSATTPFPTRASLDPSFSIT